MKPYILKLDRPRELRFGFKAAREIRNKFGERSMESLLRIKWDEIPVLVWAGLRWDDKALTVPQVEDFLDDAIPKNHTIMDITGITLGALAAHMGVDLKKEEADDTEKELEKAVVNGKDLTQLAEEIVTKAKEKKEEKKKVTEVTPSTRKRKK